MKLLSQMLHWWALSLWCTVLMCSLRESACLKVWSQMMPWWDLFPWCIVKVTTHTKGFVTNCTKMDFISFRHSFYVYCSLMTLILQKISQISHWWSLSLSCTVFMWTLRELRSQILQTLFFSLMDSLYVNFKGTSSSEAFAI